MHGVLVDMMQTSGLDMSENVDLDDIDIEEPFDNYELDSRKALVLLGRLEKWLGKELNPVVIFNYPTIAELATRLGELYL